MRPSSCTALAVAAVALLSGATPTTSSAAVPLHSRSMGSGPATSGYATPFSGDYLGHDWEERPVRFHLNAHGVVLGLTIGHHHLGQPVVEDGAWRTTCVHGVCSRGHWVTHKTANGHWWFADDPDASSTFFRAVRHLPWFVRSG